MPEDKVNPPVTVQRARENLGSSLEVSRDELLSRAKPFPAHEEMVIEQLTEEEAKAFWAAINEM